MSEQTTPTAEASVATVINSVREFLEKFEANTDPAFWIKLVEEEMKELIEAAEAFNENDTHETRVHMLKEVSDLAYVWAGFTITLDALVSKGENEITDEERDFFIAAAILGSQVQHMFLQIAPLYTTHARNEAFARVHASNMSKLDDEGKPIKREDGKVMKGPNYKPPVLDDLIVMPARVLN